MRVLFLIDNLDLYGAQRSVANLAPALQSLGHRCEVAALWPPYGIAEELEHAGIRAHRLDIRRSWAVAEGVGRLWRLLRRGRFDVLHSNLFFAEIYSALTLPLMPQVRRCVTLHDLGESLGEPSSAKVALRTALRRFALGHCFDGITAVSEAAADHYTSAFGCRGIRVIHNGVETSADGTLSAPLARARLRALRGIGREEFVLVNLARLVPIKGHELLISALAALRREGLRPRLIIAGAGPLRGTIHEAVKRTRLEDQVSLTGALAHADALQLLLAADALVVASISEGFSLPPAEAMALGRPVVASRTGGLPELIQDGVSGLLFPAGNVEALAGCIRRLMTDPALCKRLGDAAKKVVEAKFSVGAIARQWDEYYSKLLRQRSTLRRHAVNRASGRR